MFFKLKVSKSHEEYNAMNEHPSKLAITPVRGQS